MMSSRNNKKKSVFAGLYPSLTDQQKKALELIEEGQSVCVTGPGGSGKTWFAKEVLKGLPDWTTAKTATTGSAALELKGIYEYYHWGIMDMMTTSCFCRRRSIKFVFRNNCPRVPKIASRTQTRPGDPVWNSEQSVQRADDREHPETEGALH